MAPDVSEGILREKTIFIKFNISAHKIIEVTPIPRLEKGPSGFYDPLHIACKFLCSQMATDLLENFQ